MTASSPVRTVFLISKTLHGVGRSPCGFKVRQVIQNANNAVLNNQCLRSCFRIRIGCETDYTACCAYGAHYGQTTLRVTEIRRAG